MSQSLAGVGRAQVPLKRKILALAAALAGLYVVLLAAISLTGSTTPVRAFLNLLGVSTAGLLVLAVGAAIYLIPTAIAITKKRRQKTAIIALNVLLGWLVIGWVVALVWALVEEK